MPNNIVLLVALGKFEPNHVLVNINKLKPYLYVDPNESTLWEGQDYCHIVFFLRYPCLNFNHVIINKDFHNVFAFYGRSHIKKSNAKKTALLVSYDVMFKLHSCKNHLHHNGNIFKKCLKWFWIFMKFVLSIKHCDSICLE